MSMLLLHRAYSPPHNIGTHKAQRTGCVGRNVAGRNKFKINNYYFVIESTR